WRGHRGPREYLVFSPSLSPLLRGRSGLAAQESPSWDSARVKATVALVILTGAIPPGGAEGSARVVAGQRSARRGGPAKGDAYRGIATGCWITLPDRSSMGFDSPIERTPSCSRTHRPP